MCRPMGVLQRKSSENVVTWRKANTPSHYRAYLVRLWRDNAEEPWRASAQSVQSGGLVRFATLQELFVFLEIHSEDAHPADDPPP